MTRKFHLLYLKSIINFNTEKRNQATSDFEMDFSKIFKNAFYRITREYACNRLKVKFIRKIILEKLLNNNQKYLSIDFMSLIQIMIVLHLSKMKFSWLSQ